MNRLGIARRCLGRGLFQARKWPLSGGEYKRLFVEGGRAGSLCLASRDPWPDLKRSSHGLVLMSCPQPSKRPRGSTLGHLKTPMTNHDRPRLLRPLLKDCVWEHSRIGTRHPDCIDSGIRFDEGKKSRFAAEQYIYVPLWTTMPTTMHLWKVLHSGMKRAKGGAWSCTPDTRCTSNGNRTGPAHCLRA